MTVSCISDEDAWSAIYSCVFSDGVARISSGDPYWSVISLCSDRSIASGLCVLATKTGEEGPDSDAEFSILRVNDP